MTGAGHWVLVMTVGAACVALAPAALAAQNKWTPEKVAKATQLQDIVFFKERTTRQTTRGPQPWYLWSKVTSGEVDGLSSAANRLPSREAAKTGELGLRFDLNARGRDPVWQVEIAAEITPPIASMARTKNFFDAYAYRPHGALEFDLRGDAKGKGLAVALCAPYELSRMPRWTPLDPYLSAGAGWQHVVVPVKDMDLSDPKSDLHVATRVLIGGKGYVGRVEFDVDNIVLHSDGPEPERPPVRLDHVGYLPDEHKVAFVAGSRLFDIAGRPFRVRAVGPDGAPTGDAVLTGTLSLRVQFEPRIYGEWVYEADFSALSTPGRYVLEVPGVGRSVGFYVSDAVYDYLFYHLSRMFMYQRNGGALPAKNAFEWARNACYTDPIPYQSNPAKTKRILHGWIDAGDARVYPHDLETGQLMLAYELSKKKLFDGQLNLPESGDGLPDVVDQLRWECDYIREMQLDNGACIGYILPQTKNGSNPDKGRDKGWANDPDPRYIMDRRVSYAESVRLGACMAAMARILKPYDAADSRSFADAALRAWQWAENNVPEARPGRPAAWQHDVLWAAVEMWRLTGDEQYDRVIRNLKDIQGRWDSNAWKQDSAPFAWVSYALDPHADPAIRSEFLHKFLGQLDVLFGLSAKDPYAVAVDPAGWYHCPARMGDTASLLMMAYELTGREKYRQLAEEYIHYVCGRNPYDLCDVSNVAEQTYSTPFNMYQWTPDRTAWMPGYVAYMSVDQGGNLSRFVARRIRVTRWNWYFGEPDIGFNSGMVAACMMLMTGKHYDDLIHQGAFPGYKPYRPGLPFAPTRAGGPWGSEPVVPGPAIYSTP